MEFSHVCRRLKQYVQTNSTKILRRECLHIVTPPLFRVTAAVRCNDVHCRRFPAEMSPCYCGAHDGASPAHE